MPTLLQVGLFLTLGALAQVRHRSSFAGALFVELSSFRLSYHLSGVSGVLFYLENNQTSASFSNMLSPMEQAEVMSYLGETCNGDADEALRLIEKRKPNFMRYGRSITFGKKGSDPNFLRFGRNQPSFLRFGKAAGDPNFLRFGRATADPNFLRFGKRSVDPNFLRFGRKPNFLRFGK
ncbi:hypothetical protein NECAME_08941 [Necator americanus]|uniref:Uncharacterized protein n=1 Tax=Necator americanus TaxID=51031 RepID=W2TID1_NECAM|nr:hypothetical protein NECAME_08941 [Necator americanus]ETN80767.1 hypothetical protein NECAME_08941 [Necator americanus]